MTVRRYASPEAFKHALEQRLRNAADTGGELVRKRQLLVFDRFLARVVAAVGDAAILKGGLVLELRIDRARTTKDIDLRMTGSPEDLLAKLHAYTLPRARPNSRVKDLPDIALLATVRRVEASELRRALEQTFAFRRSHALPAMLPDPPPTWARPYAAMAREDQLVWATLDEVTEAAKAFLDPVLAGRVEVAWSPENWAWG